MVAVYRPSVVTVRRLPWSILHLVCAGGGPEDGSLWGFKTLCGREIRDDDWAEIAGGVGTCRVCLKVKAAVDAGR